MASGYVPGAVAGILGGSTTTEAVSPNKKLKAKQKALQALFSKPNQIAVTQQEAETTSKKKKKKKKAAKENTDVPVKAGQQSPKKRKSGDDAKSDSQPDPPAKKVKVAKGENSKPAQPESVTKKKEKPKDRNDQRENRKKKKNPEKDSRTLFVGNLPNSIEKRKVTNFFKKYGVIESVRFRSAAPADLKLPKKAIMNTKAFHEGLKTMNGYVVFKKKGSAKDALAGNGEVLGGNHIRVDIAKNAKKMDTKTSVFIGNLPFDTDDEQLRTHFEDCGKIEAIRVIRDGRTGLGKGFGYIKFEDKDGMEMALMLNGRLFQKRTIRVQHAEEQAAKKKKDKVPKSGDESSKTATSPKTPASDGDKKKKAFSRSMPSNVASKDFQGVKAKSIEKMKKQQKKKKIRKKQRELAKGLNIMKGSKDSVTKGSKDSVTKGSKDSATKSSKGSTMRGTKGSSARARIAKRVKRAAPRKT